MKNSLQKMKENITATFSTALAKNIHKRAPFWYIIRFFQHCNYNIRYIIFYKCIIYLHAYSYVLTIDVRLQMELPRQKAVAKVALLIANGNYDNHEKLRTPKNDVTKVAKILSDLGFHIICFADLTLSQMKTAIQIFGDSLIEGTYGFYLFLFAYIVQFIKIINLLYFSGLFYFAGHGFKMQENYMLSIDAPENYLRTDAICESQVLSIALKNDPALLVVILDMCQTFPPV